MQAKVIQLLLIFILRYLRKHPEQVDKVLDGIARHIPGHVDDSTIAFVRKLLGI